MRQEASVGMWDPRIVDALARIVTRGRRRRPKVVPS